MKLYDYIDSQIAHLPASHTTWSYRPRCPFMKGGLPNIRHPTVQLTLPAVMATAGLSNCGRGSQYKYLLQLKPGRISNGQNLITWTWPARLLCKNHTQNLLGSHSGISSERHCDDPVCQDAAIGFDTSKDYPSHFLQHWVISWKFSTQVLSSLKPTKNTNVSEVTDGGNYC